MDPLWLQFSLSALGVIGAGTLIGRVSGDLGDRLRLGRAWAGAVLLSLATTLPELVATVTVALHGALGMAIGGILGSVIFNLFILVFVDLFDRQSIYQRVSRNHIATGLLGCGLLGLLMAGLAIGGTGAGGPGGIRVGHVGLIALGMLGLYGVGQYVLFRVARSTFREAGQPHETRWSRLPVGWVLLTYAALVAVILVSAYNLAVSAEGLAARYSLGATFAGATLLGIVTSLPELTNGLTCGKQREYDLAVGNILGANAFVFVVLVVADVCYVEGPVFQMVVRSEVISSITMAALAIVMQGIVLIAIARRSTAQLGRLSVISVFLTLLYAASLVLAYHPIGS